MGRKELKQQYKLMKPEMGIMIVRSNNCIKCYIEATVNLKGTINSTRFQLTMGSHRCKELQRDFKEYGESNFIIEVLESLEYDMDESKTDYSGDLTLLQMLWEEKMQKDNNNL